MTIRILAAFFLALCSVGLSQGIILDETGTPIGISNPLDMSAAEAGYVDSTNSSSTPLGDAAVFTGTGYDISNYATITVFVDTDLDGVLSMQFSTDNSNWDRAKAITIDQTIGSGSVHTLKVVAQYFRVVFTNSTGNGSQGHLRLQTIYHKYRSGFLVSSGEETISKITDSQIVRVSNDPFLDISRGLYANRFSIHKFGFNGAVPNGSFADIWAYGPSDASYNWTTVAEKFRVASGGNVADTSDGAGARTIQIIYLDSTGVQKQQQLTLAGASASASTTFTGRRVIRSWVDTAGTILSNNTGRIIIENETANQIVSTIEAGVGQTELSMYTIPLGYTGYLTRIEVSVSVGLNKDADVKMWQRQSGYVASAPFGAKRLVRQWGALQGTGNTIVYKSFKTFPALTDLWFEAQGNGATTKVDVDYDLILIKDEAATAPQ